VSQSEGGGRRELVCVECGTTAPPDAYGWSVYLTDDETPERAVYCPHCAQREFDS
jgi:DNA-directed RNA polymerase subunit RPC12/RpoP